MNLKDKVFVVTGGGNGIGREVTLGLLARGAKVAALDISETGLAQTTELAKAGTNLSTHVLNIADREAVEALPEKVIAEHGAVDGVLNVAGVIQQFVKVVDLPYEEVEKVMNINFWGVLYMCKAFIPHLVKRPQAALVNVSSMGSYAAVPGQAVYGASKAAVSLLTQALSAELTNTSVTTTIIYPGAIGTNITANSGVKTPGTNRSSEELAKQTAKTTPAPKAAEVIIDAMVKGKFRATIGSDATMMDRLARLSPRKATEIIAKKMGALLG